MAEAVAQAKGVTKRFQKGGAPALDAVDLTILGGCMTGLVGPDGAGKTTMIRILAGLVAPEAGEVTVLGRPALKADRARIGYMPQRFGLYEDLTVLENLTLYADLRDVGRDERAAAFDRLLDFTDLKRFTARLAGRLSGGMKQKLGLACALLSEPRPGATVAVMRAGRPKRKSLKSRMASPLICPTCQPDVSIRIVRRAIAACARRSMRPERACRARSECSTSARVTSTRSISPRVRTPGTVWMGGREPRGPLRGSRPPHPPPPLRIENLGAGCRRGVAALRSRRPRTITRTASRPPPWAAATRRDGDDPERAVRGRRGRLRGGPGAAVRREDERAAGGGGRGVTGNGV